MQLAKFILCLLLTLPLVFAGPHDIEIGKFMKTCLLENETFIKERITPNSYIISVGKFQYERGDTYQITDSFLITVNETNFSEISLVENQYEIEAALTEKYARLNITYDALYPTQKETGDILAMILRYNQSREPQEHGCKISTGTDRFQCIDRESCLRACYTPMCNPVAMGVGWPFVDSIWSFTNSSRDIDSNVSSIIVKLNEIDGKSPELEPLLDDIEASFISIQAATDRIADNGIFKNEVYSFCWPIKFNTTSLITGKAMTKIIKERLVDVLSIEKRASEMASSASKRAKICEEGAYVPPTERLGTFWSRLPSLDKEAMKLFLFTFWRSPLSPVPALGEIRGS
jgi:hypothetical protein